MANGLENWLMEISSPLASVANGFFRLRPPLVLCTDKTCALYDEPVMSQFCAKMSGSKQQTWRLTRSR